MIEDNGYLQNASDGLEIDGYVDRKHGTFYEDHIPNHIAGTLWAVCDHFDANQIITKQAENIVVLEETIRLHKVWDFPADIQSLTVRLEAAEADCDRMKEALIGIKRASNSRRAEKDGERHEYYYHTANAALNNIGCKND